LDGTIENPLKIGNNPGGKRGTKVKCTTNGQCENNSCGKPALIGPNWCCPTGTKDSDGFCSDATKQELLGIPVPIPENEYLPHIGGGIWWATDTERAECQWPEKPWWQTTAIIHPVGWVYGLINDATTERKDMEECLEKYTELKDSNPEQAYAELTKCCGYLDQACVDSIVQPYCAGGTGNVSRGCFGDPHILTVDNVVGSISACDNPAVIPPGARCIQDIEGKLCTGFPYGCQTGPLWTME
jgi:hypothetical protein